MVGWFAETTLVAAGLATVAALVSRLRRVGPAVRHILWLVVLIKLMTPALVSWPWAVTWRGLNEPRATSTTVSSSFDFEDVKFQPPSGEPATLEDITEDVRDRHHTMSIAPASSPTGVVEVASVETSAQVLVPSDRTSIWWLDSLQPTTLPHGIVSAWLTISVVVGIGQLLRILRFRQRLRAAIPAPESLVEEAERIGQRLNVPVPELLVVPDLSTPLLWCLGRPQLVLPGRLVKTLALEQWRGILTHELAHLHRRDHWISRLELLAGLVWWWNPLYWLTRARLDAEAELACDAWVVWAQPKDRLGYAEVLFDICSLSLPRPPAPTLGVAGSGRFFERRLTMILHEHVPCRLSPLSLLGACLLVLFALPSWSVARPVPPDPENALALTAMSPVPDHERVVSTDGDADDDDEKVAKKTKDDDDDDAADDDDDDDDDDADDDDDDKPTSRAKAKARAEAKAKAKAKKSEKAKKPGRDIEASRIEKEIESKFGSGSEFEKTIEQLGERIGKEIEEKFGPDFEKKMEKLGKEIEEKFGPDFEKKMEKLGKEMEAKFGPGSEFEKKMKELGKEMEAKFGPGSEFEKQIKEARAGSRPKDSTAESGKPSSSNTRVGVSAKVRKRERRIQELEAQVRKLVDEIKSLKAEERRGEDE
jgi:beta-lactamase regulating signal transducer with metallopeptidase domain